MVQQEAALVPALPPAGWPVMPRRWGFRALQARPGAVRGVALQPDSPLCAPESEWPSMPSCATTAKK